MSQEKYNHHIKKYAQAQKEKHPEKVNEVKKRNKSLRRQGRPRKAPITLAQSAAHERLSVNLPVGAAVTDERHQHNKVIPEDITDYTASAFQNMTRQCIATPVRRLFDNSEINAQELAAIGLMRMHHDRAFWCNITSSFQFRVDSSGSTASDMEIRVEYAIRLEKAFKAIGAELGKIAWVTFLERPLEDLLGNSYKAIGQHILHKAKSRSEITGAGKAGIVLAARQLARHYTQTDRVEFNLFEFTLGKTKILTAKDPEAKPTEKELLENDPY